MTTLKTEFDAAVRELNQASEAARRSNEGQCLRKKPYMSRLAADTTVAKCWEKRNVRLRAYQCPNCRWWHLTKQISLQAGAQ